MCIKPLAPGVEQNDKLVLASGWGIFVVNIGSGSGWVPSGKIYPDLCRYMASLSHN